jgi:uncharacterized protein YaiE (UPF0345 family)
MIKANEYFDGKVKSLGFESDRGRATVGVMEAGEFVFGTDGPELMQVVSGTIHAKLPGQPDFKAYGPGASFPVPAKSKFQVRLDSQAAYLCIYG